jgi:hypothetical protein
MERRATQITERKNERSALRTAVKMAGALQFLLTLPFSTNVWLMIWNYTLESTFTDSAKWTYR